MFFNEYYFVFDPSSLMILEFSNNAEIHAHIYLIKFCIIPLILQADRLEFSHPWAAKLKNIWIIIWIVLCFNMLI